MSTINQWPYFNDVEFRPDGKDFAVYGDDGNKTTYVRSELK